MKKKQSLLLAAGIVLALFAGCNSQQTKGLKLGADLPLTGDVAYYGSSSKNGIELAKEELLRSSFKGEEIDITYEDNQGQGKEAAIAMNKLASVNGVPAVIGCGSSTETMAAAPVAQKNSTVLISPVSSATSVTNAGDFIFRTCPSDLTQANDLGDWLTEENINNIAVIFVNSSWGTGFKNNFVEHFQQTGGKIAEVLSSDPGQTDFRAQVARIKTLQVQAYVFLVYAKEGGALVRQVKEAQVKLPIYGADPWSQADFRNGASNYDEGVKYTTPTQDSGKGFSSFRTAYIAKYHQEPDVYASNGYDCLMLLAKVYKDGARSGAEFQVALSKIKGFEGATGMTTFDKNGDVIGKKFGRFVIKNNQPQLLQK